MGTDRDQPTLREAPPSGLQGRRILVTGANGFLGGWTATLAHAAGAEVTGVDLPDPTARGDRFRKSVGCGEILLVEAPRDLTPSFWRGLLEKTRPDILAHLAGSINRGSDDRAWRDCVRANVVLAMEVLDATLSLPPAQRPVLLFPGSQMEYGMADMPWREDTVCAPATPYGATKLAASSLLRSATVSGAIQGCVARFALIFGPGQPATMFLPELIIKGLRGTRIEMTQGIQRRRFVFAPDASRFLLAAGARLLAGEAVPPLINAPACEPLAIADLARRVAHALEQSVDLQIGALPMRKTESLEAWPDTTLAESLALTSLTPLDQALSRNIDWYRRNPWFSEESQ